MSKPCTDKPYIYQMPDGTWAYAYRGTIGDYFKSRKDALQAAHRLTTPPADSEPGE